MPVLCWCSGCGRLAYLHASWGTLGEANVHQSANLCHAHSSELWSKLHPLTSLGLAYYSCSAPQANTGANTARLITAALPIDLDRPEAEETVAVGVQHHAP